MTELGCINQELSDFYCNPILPRVVFPLGSVFLQANSFENIKTYLKFHSVFGG
jgi:hypothetical protein